VGAVEEHPIRRARHVVSKRRASASQDEPSLKKAKKGSEAEVSARMPEKIPHDAKEQEEEVEEEAVPTLHPRGLRSRGTVILAEGEPTRQSIMAEGAKQPEEVMERVEVEILGVSTQPGILWLRREGQRCNNWGLPVY